MRQSIAQFYLVSMTAFVRNEKSQVNWSHTFWNAQKLQLQLFYHYTHKIQCILCLLIKPSFQISSSMLYIWPMRVSYSWPLYIIKLIIHLLLMKHTEDCMKKVRISKKNGNRVLKVIETSPSPHKQTPFAHKPLKYALKIQDLKFSNEYSKLSHHDKIIHSYRYNKASSFEMNERIGSQSSGEEIIKNQDARKGQYLRQFFKKARGVRQPTYRSSDKSPYLEKKFQNKSERKLVINNRNLLQPGRNMNKQLRPMRYNSLQEKSESVQIKKSKGSQDILKQAKKLMLAGQSRKSMLVLKPLLMKDPGNPNALYICGLNLYNIGDYDRATQYLQNLMRIRLDYNMSSFFILAKIYLKQGDPNKCLAKLDQCLQVFPNSFQVFVQKGQVLMLLNKHRHALTVFQQAVKIAPQNAQIREKMLVAHQQLNEPEKVLEVIQELSKLNEFQVQRYNLSKCKALFKLRKYAKIIKQYSESNDPNLLYYLGYAYYKKEDLIKAYLALEASLNGSDDCTSSIKLMLLILCKGHDFYQAYHLLQRCQHLNVNKQDMIREFHFIEGTVCLMKRNIYEGVQKLNIIIDDVFSREDEFLKYAATQINAYIAYGYFCLGNYESCEKYYKIQKESFPQVDFDGLNYNISLNKALICYQNNQIEQSFQLFQRLCQLNPKKLQPHFCLAILYVNIFFKYQQIDCEKIKDNLWKAKDMFKRASEQVSKNHNNTGANVLYHKSVLHGFMQEWKQSIISFDDAIQKSQQNYWKYFYARASVLASIHNFTEAINDCTASINLKQSEPSPYLLRSCCYQIQGEGNSAFRDLQTYIALRPQDKEIHKLAGKLLFENGAFQDAIAAFNHQPIAQEITNIDAFLTKSKTYFLLGKFIEAAQEMLKVHRINPSQNQSLFDSKMMNLIGKLLSSQVNYNEIIGKIDSIYDEEGLQFIKHQIFKRTQRHTLKAICYFYLNKLDQTISQLQLAMTIKQKTVMKESLIQGSTREDEKDTRLFVYQMNFNISLCYAMKGEIQKAKEFSDKLHFNSNDIFYQPHKKYINILCNLNTSFGQEQILHVEVFPSRNKISNFIKQVPILIHSRTIYSRLCIPFPKVEPPEIFPVFDDKLIKQFSIERVERKPEAPWICREEDSIMFTDRIQKYSRLQVQESGTEKSVTSQEVDSSHMSMQSINGRRNKKTAIQLNYQIKSTNFQSSKKDIDV